MGDTVSKVPLRANSRGKIGSEKCVDELRLLKWSVILLKELDHALKSHCYLQSCVDRDNPFNIFYAFASYLVWNGH